ncbi:MAG: hypothetical protein U0401_18835 [Anaerolineae bacterium]
MAKPKVKQVKRSRIDRTLSYPVLKVQVGAWLLIFLLFGCFFGLFTLRIFEFGSATTEEFVAEISDKWVEQIESKMGGYQIYQIRLKREDGEFNCSVSPIMMKLWGQLEVGKSYNFSVRQTGRQCFISDASPVGITDSAVNR